MADRAHEEAGRRAARRHRFVASGEFWLGVATTAICLILVLAYAQRIGGWL